jgi:hypothetical protein
MPLMIALPRVGWGLMIGSAALWLVLPALPFTPLSGEQQLAAGGALIVTAEIVFWIGAALAGPEAARRMRSWWRRRPQATTSDAEGLSQRDQS